MDSVKFFKIAREVFLYSNNRNETMFKHNCDELGLFKNPTWLVANYFEKSDIELSDSDKKEFLDFLETSAGKEITQAFLCPKNRRRTIKKYWFDGNDFDKYHFFIMCYADAKKKRKKFLKIKKITAV